MPLYFPNGISEEEHRFLYQAFLDKEPPKNIVARGIHEFFSFRWKGSSSRVQQLLSEDAEHRQVFIECLVENPRWIRKDLSLGMKILRNLREDHRVLSDFLKSVIETAYKVDAVINWAKTHKNTTAREFLKAQPHLEALYVPRFASALKKNDRKVLRLLGPILENTYIDERTPLIHSIVREDWRLFKILLRSETIDIGTRAYYGNWDSMDALTALLNHYKKTGDSSRIKYFFEKKGEQIVDEMLNTVQKIYLEAVKNDDIEFVRLLLQKPMDVNANAENEDSALHCAVINGSMEMIELLLQQPKIDVNAGGWNRFKAITYARLLGHDEIVERLLMVHGVDVCKGDLASLEEDSILNREFLSELQIVIPEPPEGVDNSEILTLFKECEKNGVVWAEDTEEGGRGMVSYGLKRLIKYVNKRDDQVTAIPVDPEERELFYQNLEKILKHIAFHLRSLSFQERVIVLEFLGQGGNHCAIRWQQEALNAYSYLTDGNNGTPREKFKAVLRSFLMQCYKDFTRKYGGEDIDNNPHHRQAWLKCVGKELGIPGAELVQYSDQYGNYVVPAKEIALELFFREFFTSKRIFVEVITHINDRKVRPQLADAVGDLWKEKIALEWACEMTKEKFKKEVAVYAERLKIKRKYVAAILAERLRSILESEKSEDYHWLRKIKKVEVSEEPSNRIHEALRQFLTSRVNDRILDEETYTTVTTEAIEELLYDLEIFK